MESKKPSLSFGRYLQAVRLEKKISLEQIAEQTRIGVSTLLFIEQEDHSQLPASVFVKGFLRAYAKAINADGDKVVRQYEARLSVVRRITEAEALTKKQTDRLWLRLLIAVVLFFFVIILSIYGMDFFSAPTPESLSTGSGHSGPGQRQAISENEQANKNSAVPAAAPAQKLVLRVSVIENTWLKVIIDEKESTEYNLGPGDHLEFAATAGYNLLIGNAGGLKITFNDKPVSIPGKSGQVVNLHLP